MGKKFTLVINLDPDAFLDDDALEDELNRIMRRVAQRVRAGETNGPVQDLRGRRSGGWLIEEEPEDEDDELPDRPDVEF